MQKIEKDKTAAEKPKRDVIRHLDGTIELNIKIPWSEIKRERQKIQGEYLQKVEIKGFRKGKAPKKLSEKSLPEDTIKEELLKKLVTDAYKNAITKNGLNPVITPEIQIEEFVEGKDLELKAETSEEPKVELGDYKREVKNLTAKSKIVIPGKEENKPSIDEILSAGISKAKFGISKILVERESSRLLTQLLDEIKTLGMTLDQYLKSKKISGEELRAEYLRKAEGEIKLEFFLRKVADEEKITVSEKDITEAIDKIEDEKQRESVRNNPYFVASIVRQQKTIDFLSKI